MGQQLEAATRERDAANADFIQKQAEMTRVAAIYRAALERKE